jgi:hypothetical protein
MFVKCSVRHNVRETLLSKDLVKEEGGQLTLNATESELMSEAYRMGQELTRAYGTDDIPFMVSEGELVMNDDLLKSIDGVDPEIQDSLENELLASMRNVMRQLGLSETVVDKLRDREGNPIQGVAAADLLNRSIQYLEGNESELPEEVIHFYVQALKDTSDPLYSSMRDRITSEPEYEQVTRDYQDLGYTQEDIIDEAIAKVILNRAKAVPSEDRNTRWWNRVLRRLKEMFNVGTESTDPFKQAALDMFRKDMTQYREVVSQFTRGQIMRSMGTPQTAVRDRVVNKHSSLKQLEMTLEEVKKAGLKISDLLLENAPGGIIARYQDSSGKIYSFRATDRHQIEFLKTMRDTSYKGNEALTEGFRTTGTQLHETAKFITMKLATEDHRDKFNMPDLGHGKVPTKAELKIMSGLNDVQFSRFVKEIEKIMLAMHRKQTEIDPNGKVDVLPEVQLAHKDTAGTMDLMFLFSNGKAAIYDYKFISPGKYALDPSTDLLAEDQFLGKKREGYESQIMFYKEALLSEYGVEDVLYSRLVPGHFKLNWDTKEGKPAGIKDFTIGQDVDPYLMQIPMTEEKSENLEIRKGLGRIYRRLKELTPMGGKNMSNSAKAERDLLVKAIKELHNDSDLRWTMSDMDLVLNEVNRALNGEVMMTDNELGQAYSMLGLLEHLHTMLDAKVSEMPEDVQVEKREQLNTRLRKSLDLRMAVGNEYNGRVLKKNYDLSAVNIPTTLKDMLSSTGTVNNEILAYTANLLREREESAMTELNPHVQRFDDLRKGLEAWGKRNGKSLPEIYDMFLEDTGYGLSVLKVLSQEFKEERNSMLALYETQEPADVKKALEWMRSNYRIKDNAKELYERDLERTRGFLRERYISETSQGYQRGLERFIAQRDVWGSEEAWMNRDGHRYLELTPEKFEKAQSEKFRSIKDHPELMAWYDAWKEHMHMIDMMIPNESIRHNFMPSILADTGQVLMRGDNYLKYLKESVKRSLVVETDLDEQLGGSRVKVVPLKYIKPLRGNNGEIDPSLYSRDMFGALIQFTEEALRHRNLSDVEGEVMMLRQMLAQSKVHLNRKKGSRISDEVGLLEGDPQAMRIFDALTDSKMYGVTFSEDDTFNFFGSEISKAKLLRLLMSSWSRIRMTGPVKGAAAAFIAGSFSTKAMFKGNPNYGENAYMDAVKMSIPDWAGGQGSRFAALSSWGDASSEPYRVIMERENRAHTASRVLDPIYGYYPLIPADRMLHSMAYVALLHNWAVNEKGEVKRLSELPEGTKSLAETLEVKDGRVVTEIDPAVITELRMIHQAEMRGITGSMALSDYAAYHHNIYLMAVMQFKGWMPGMAQARLGEMRYDRTTRRFFEGRYLGALKAAGARYSKENMDAELGGWALLESVARTAARAAMTLVMDTNYTILAAEKESVDKKRGWTAEKDRVYNERRERLKQEFTIFRATTTIPSLRKAFESEAEENRKFEEFLVMRQASVRSTMMEMRQILGMMFMSMLLGAAFDDDDELNYANRRTSDLLARVIMEMAQFINPIEFAKVMQQGIPIVGMLESIAWIANRGFQDTVDLLIEGGEAPPVKWKPSPLLKIAPGFNNLSWIAGID